ncbi:MAG: aminoacyl-tRNA hydrolase [Patescibacteria group bacterium]|jgi:PTH1 family peptidyl-tRNA hydrolase
MKLIIGLGNPGKEYENTRHNAGFVFVDELLNRPEFTRVGEELEFRKDSKFNALLAETQIKGEKIILVKPQTFMNLSGESVRKIKDFYKVDESDIIVVSDDADLPIGMARIRKNGTSGGHNGLENIISVLDSDGFYRIRLGIAFKVEEKTNLERKEFVLEKFTDRELPILKDTIQEVIMYILGYLGSKEEIPSHSLEVVGREE